MKKKTLLLIIVIILLVAGGAFYYFNYYKKFDTAKCLEEISKMSDEQIVEKLISPSYNSLGKSVEINTLIPEHLVCGFLNNPSEQTYTEAVTLLKELKISDASRARYTDTLEKVHSANYMLSALTFLGMDVVCPGGEENSKISEALLNLSSEKGSLNATCNIYGQSCGDASNNYCQMLKKMEDNTVRANVLASPWSFKDSQRALYQALNRIILALRFDNEQTAEKVCQKLPDTKGIDTCISKIKTLMDFKNLRDNFYCASNQKEERIKDLMCQAK